MVFPSSAPIEPTGPARPGRRRALRALAALPWLAAACGRDATVARLAAGHALPDIELPDLDGRMRRLGPGQPMLINFWATWCPPCRAEMASLERLHQALGPAGLAVYAISVDEDLNLVREFVLQQRLGFPVLHDRGRGVTEERLGIRVFPTTLLVRRGGAVAEVVLGERTWDAPPSRDAARALL